MVGQNEGQGAFGNDLTNVMTADSQEELARRFVSFISFFSKELWNSRSKFQICQDSVINICRVHVYTLQKQPQSEANSRKILQFTDITADICIIS